MFTNRSIGSPRRREYINCVKANFNVSAALPSVPNSEEEFHSMMNERMCFRSFYVMDVDLSRLDG